MRQGLKSGLSCVLKALALLTPSACTALAEQH